MVSQRASYPLVTGGSILGTYATRRLWYWRRLAIAISAGGRISVLIYIYWWADVSQRRRRHLGVDVEILIGVVVS